MSNARNLANLLGTNTTVQTAKLADDAVTAAKLKSDAIALTDLPSGAVVQAVRAITNNPGAMQTTSTSYLSLIHI